MLPLIDIIFIVIFIIAFLKGYLDGFLSGLLQLVVLSIAMFITVNYSNEISFILQKKVGMSYYTSNLVAFVMLFFIITVLLNSIKSMILKATYNYANLGSPFFNSILGGLLSIIKTLIIFSFLWGVVKNTQVANALPNTHDSKFIPVFNQVFYSLGGNVMVDNMAKKIFNETDKKSTKKEDTSKNK